ncbi:MAG: aspartate/glutamate racemase family protein [Tissierellia bacterium]|nr:aspartate/glutamate racemase family protein [Tissierellia bacterium]
MKTIGLIGGMSWESTVTYYKLINEKIRDELGGLHSAKILLYSVDFDEIERYQSNDEWDKSGEILGEIAYNLELGGADFIVLCTNTMHKNYEDIKEHINIPFIHIAECTADSLKKVNIKRVGLLGTKYTMEQDFYKAIIIESGIEVITPEKEDIETINSIIFDELCLGVISEESKEVYLRILDKLVERGAEGIILGCTEIGLLINQEDTEIRLFDTTEIHAETAALMAISDS